MVFTEPSFLFLFLPIVLAVSFIVPKFLRNLTLLFASLVFYAWDEKAYSLIMIASILFNYLMGILISKRAQPNKKMFMGLCICGNIGLLVVFKYANFIANNVDFFLATLELPMINLPPVHLPIGISFFTFQSMSYVFDVYRGDVEVQKNPLNLGLYVSLFPQLIAGPIVRYTTVVAEIKERSIDVPLFASGVRRFVVGLSKKIMIANPTGYCADQIFRLHDSDLSAPTAWLGLVCYAIQIYFDFSGYSDMAIGLGRILGFHFLENFDHPYSSLSITEFWRKWHISLSTWFRDYLYIPLGGSHGRPWLTYRNLMVVFILCGLWHGASWNFLLWGMLHGSLLIIERLGFTRVLERLPRPARLAYVLLSVLLGWVLFRADTLPAAGLFLKALFTPFAASIDAQPLSFFIDTELTLIIIAGIVGSSTKVMRTWRFLVTHSPKLVGGIGATLATAALLTICSVLIAGSTYNPFIYFRF